MSRLNFIPTATAPANIIALALALEEDYMVAGHATHFALTEQGEVALAYPTSHGRRLILTYPLANAEAYVELNKRQLAAKSEDEEMAIIVERHSSAPGPDEHEMSKEDIERCDNHDGTFTLGARLAMW